MELSVFEAVGAMLPGMLPDELGPVRQRAHKWGIKVWFGTDTPGREHYEAQVVGTRDVPGAAVLAIEVGFHSEHPKDAENQAVLDRLLALSAQWRPDVGDEAEAGVFLGRAHHWRRISETWADPDLSDPDCAFEIAARLTDYITAIEPLRRGPP